MVGGKFQSFCLARICKVCKVCKRVCKSLQQSLQMFAKKFANFTKKWQIYIYIYICKKFARFAKKFANFVSELCNFSIFANFETLPVPKGPNFFCKLCKFLQTLQPFTNCFANFASFWKLFYKLLQPCFFFIFFVGLLFFEIVDCFCFAYVVILSNVYQLFLTNLFYISLNDFL